MKAELENLSRQVRTLVAARRYADVQFALEAYSRTLAGIVSALPPEDPSRLELDAEWRRLWEETRRRLLAGRAQAAARLARLPKTYGDLPETARRWRCFA